MHSTVARYVQRRKFPKARDPRSGIRDAEAVQALAAQVGLHAVDDAAMLETTGALSGGEADAFGARPAIKWCSCKTDRLRTEAAVG